jgi:hypothetical protein
MRTIADIKKELKAKGIKGITGKKKAELEAMLAKHGEKNENDAFFEDAYKQLGKAPSKTKKSKVDMGSFLASAEKKMKAPYIAKLTKDPKTGKLMKIPKSPEIDKRISTPKKMSVSLQEKLVKAGLKGGNKMKYNV